MQILGNLFYAMIFVSAVGSIYCVLSLFANHILRCMLPLWFCVCGMLLFCVPVLSWQVVLVSPEKQEWLDGFYTVCRIWSCGCGFLLVSDLIRLVLAKRAVKNYRICKEERIHNLCRQSGEDIGLKKMPELYWGTLNHPICVTGIVRPAIIMNEEILAQLSESEVSAVLCHELTHIKRKHFLLQRIYTYVCILNWMNPFVWIARGECSLHFETDCDYHVLRLSRGKITAADYASAVIRLLELSAFSAAGSRKGMGALSFLQTKRRIQRITAGSSKRKERITGVLLAILCVITLGISIQFSRGYFYPYPAYQTGTEYSAGYST